MDPSTDSTSRDAPTPVTPAKRPRIGSTRTETQGQSTALIHDPVINVYPTTIPHPEPSTFLPNATMLFAVTAIADNHLVVNNQRFITQNPLWHPMLTRIYVALLFYLQNLRVMKELNVLPHREHSFLSLFEREYDFSTIPVPSYVEPFLKCLTTTKSIYSEYGPIGPRLPELFLDDTSSFMFDPLLRSYLPDMVCLFRGYANVIRAGPASAHRDFDRNLINPSENGDQPIGPDAPSVITRYARLSPGIRERIILGSRSASTFASQYGLLPIPLHDLSSPIESWDEYIFPGNDTNWFSRLLLLFREYCLCWPGSVTLKDISVANGEFGLLEISYLHQYPQPPLNTSEREFRDEADSISRVAPFPIDVAKIASLAQMNAMHHFSYIPDMDNQAIIYNHTHSGPFWTSFPPRTQNSRYNALLVVPESLSKIHKAYSNS